MLTLIFHEYTHNLPCNVCKNKHMILCSWESFCSGFCVVFLSNGLWNKSIGV